ncbi:hypothetical protein CEW81_08035 [Kluyvera genomosp. 3]|uniref:Uncharacterized protein n=1 Tax=Kluyvera genomosp. 3 TaxID=2774055 RepID=A0A248KHL1_9ENTR|nr:hypothetical protein CEW81_08035 [Kluyvera genomosp. 3]
MYQRGKIVVGKDAVISWNEKAFYYLSAGKFSVGDNLYNSDCIVQLFTKSQGKIALNNKTLIVIGVQ